MLTDPMPNAIVRSMTIPPQDRPRYLAEHLTELRQAFIRSLICTVIMIVLAFLKSDWLFEALLWPFQKTLAKFPELAHQVQSLQTLTPIEAFMVNMKLASIMGLVLASPFILWQAWGFSAPAMKSKERPALLMVFILGLFFFTGGVCFGYFIIIPLTMEFLMRYNLDYHFLPQWTLQGYFGFVVNFLLVFGCVFGSFGISCFGQYRGSHTGFFSP